MVENYCLEEVVGSGQYGKVYRARDTRTKRVVAIKVVKISSFRENPKLEECTVNEIKTLSQVEDTSHIVAFIELLRSSNNYYFVYEFCANGTLEDLLKRSKILPEAQALSIFKQLLAAFKVLRQFNIMHRDLKPTNILLHEGVIKLADFGFCKSVEQHQMAQTMLGSPLYMAPEILRGQDYSIKADIWSLGVVLYELLFGFCPFEEKSIARLICLLNDKKLDIRSDIQKISPQAEALLTAMLVKDPDYRISWEALFQIPLSDAGEFLKSPTTMNEAHQQPSTPKKTNVLLLQANKHDASTEEKPREVQSSAKRGPHEMIGTAATTTASGSQLSNKKGDSNSKANAIIQHSASTSGLHKQKSNGISYNQPPTFAKAASSDTSNSIQQNHPFQENSQPLNFTQPPTSSVPRHSSSQLQLFQASAELNKIDSAPSSNDTLPSSGNKSQTNLNEGALNMRVHRRAFTVFGNGVASPLGENINCNNTNSITNSNKPAATGAADCLSPEWLKRPTSQNASYQALPPQSSDSKNNSRQQQQQQQRLSAAVASRSPLGNQQNQQPYESHKECQPFLSNRSTPSVLEEREKIMSAMETLHAVLDQEDTSSEIAVQLTYRMYADILLPSCEKIRRSLANTTQQQQQQSQQQFLHLFLEEISAIEANFSHVKSEYLYYEIYARAVSASPLSVSSLISASSSNIQLRSTLQSLFQQHQHQQVQLQQQQPFSIPVATHNSTATAIKTTF